MSLEEVANEYGKITGIDQLELPVNHLGPLDDVAPNPDVPTLPSQITDEERKLAVVQRLLKSEKNRVTVRGFELARLHPSGEWEQVARYKPGDRGHMQAKADAFWLNKRHPETLYQARVLVSAEIPEPPRANATQQLDSEASQRLSVDATADVRGGDAGPGLPDAGANAARESSVRLESPAAQDAQTGLSTPSLQEDANA